MPGPRTCRAGLAVVALTLLAGCAGVDSRSGEGTPLQSGRAAYYSDAYQGSRTASGERYDRASLTAAHRRLAFGTRVRVTNLDNGREVVVRINDRGPFTPGRVIDLSYRAAQRLDMVASGIAPVRLEVVERPR
ncbi:septal ring lytic transglycosylase RlpA family protein [Modicisalibacter coralii]|uniref:septal ring lytic transglycosylase RlpA family protein n=1 Tax=Modicisalibacter coralii TaxID=2304602 RepID=UPI00100A4EA9|nr:septal ring lytic transglycosylase RlpA family protein [Halomonas coralii]